MGVSDEEWNQRILCSDGACIGIIGKDGKCNECGTAYTGDLPLPAVDTDDADDADLKGDFFDETAADTDENDVSDITDTEWDNRALCSDGNCIGVIGPDGLCNECGKPLSLSSDVPEDGPDALSEAPEDSLSSTSPCEVSDDSTSNAH